MIFYQHILTVQLEIIIFYQILSSCSILVDISEKISLISLQFLFKKRNEHHDHHYKNKLR